VTLKHRETADWAFKAYSYSDNCDPSNNTDGYTITWSISQIEWDACYKPMNRKQEMQSISWDGWDAILNRIGDCSDAFFSGIQAFDACYDCNCKEADTRVDSRVAVWLGMEVSSRSRFIVALFLFLVHPGLS
jgi:hypothetical protein